MGELPTGIVTFLFSDIEGSTKLLQRTGAGYSDLLGTHASLIRDALSAHGGAEVSTEGDSFFVVFRSPVDAVRAAVDAQRALSAHEWPVGLTIRVRMGLHTGEGVLGGDNYAGIDVNRAARLAAAAHGGQVLLSDATRALVERALPDGASLRDLGAHRLKDISHPEHLHQLVIDGLPADFPPPRTLDARPNNLPGERTRFIGRKEVLAEVVRRLTDARLLTLTGPGGTGKTRLALRTAAEVLAGFEDGVFFVDLSPITDPGLVASTIAEALGVPEDPARSRAESLQDHLKDRRLLLVLDNFEQVTEAAQLVADLLAAAPKLAVLATSRIPLHVYGEQEFPVSPLELPDFAALPDAEAVSQYEAVALFVDRAVAAKPDFAVTNENAPAVAEICYRLDGLPLAIELAAARVKLLPPQAMLPRLQNRLQVLTAGASDLPERQRTLRGAIDWSYDLLEEAERALFARVAVFWGGASLEAVEAVCNPDGELGIDTLDGVASLVDKSLLRQTEAGDEIRFLMLETIREYALERLDESPDADAVRRRHATHLLAVAEEAEPHLTGDRQIEWLNRCDREHDNIRAAMRWSLETGEAEVGLRIGGALWRFWQQRGHLREGLKVMDEALDAPAAAAHTRWRAKAATSAGGLAYWANEYPRAKAQYEEALAIYEELELPGETADALYNLAFLSLIEGDIPTIREMLQRALPLAQEGDDALTEANIQVLLGYEGLLEGDLERAIAASEAGVAIYRTLGRRWQVGDGLTGLGEAYQLARRFDDARRVWREALDLFTTAENDTGIETVLWCMSSLAVAEEQWERAMRMIGADAALRERIGGGAPPEILSRFLGDPEVNAREHLDAETAERAWSEGRGLSTGEAIAYALEDPGDR